MIPSVSSQLAAARERLAEILEMSFGDVEQLPSSEEISLSQLVLEARTELEKPNGESGEKPLPDASNTVVEVCDEF